MYGDMLDKYSIYLYSGPAPSPSPLPTTSTSSTSSPSTCRYYIYVHVHTYEHIQNSLVCTFGYFVFHIGTTYCRLLLNGFHYLCYQTMCAHSHYVDITVMGCDECLGFGFDCTECDNNIAFVYACMPFNSKQQNAYLQIKLHNKTTTHI